MSTRWQRQQEAWQRWASDYDARIAPVERRFLAVTRPWVCGRAQGRTLEIAAGTGANFGHYPNDITLTATELNPEMLTKARERATRLGSDITFGIADAMALPFGDEQFDSVVCTYALCGVPELSGALREALRVLRPGGNLLLADHVDAASWPIRLLQRGLNLVTGPSQGEYWTRRPLLVLQEMGVLILDSQRRHFGVIECLHARKG